MKLGKINDIPAFFKLIDECRGTVELLTDEGDRLNLKSKVSQFASMTQIFAHQEELHLEIAAGDPEDLRRINSFLMKQDS